MNYPRKDKVSVILVTLLLISMFAATLNTTAFADTTGSSSTNAVVISDSPIISPEDIEKLGPGYVDINTSTTPESALPSHAYLDIPLSSDEAKLMARMAMAETMAHDGTSTWDTVKACYEVVFNRYLYDRNTNTHEFHVTGKPLSVYTVLRKNQMVIASASSFNSLSDVDKDHYINLAYQVRNQGYSVLDPSYLWWQSKNGTKGKANRIFVGWIYNENGEPIWGTATESTKNLIVGRYKGMSRTGNWYRNTYE